MITTLQTRLGIQSHADLIQSWPARVAAIVAASGFVALFAHLSVPLWFTPAPLSLQNFAVLLVGFALGPTAGFAAMMLYLLEGVSGLPVFTPAGAGGLAQLLGPTGGYLMSYPAAAAIAGFAVRGRRAGSIAWLRALAGSTAATLCIFLIGAGWLAHLLHLSSMSAVRLGVLPFLPGEVAKIAAACGIYAALATKPRTP